MKIMGYHHQLIIMNPNSISFFNQIENCICKKFVCGFVSFPALWILSVLIKLTIMTNRPKNLVRKSIVIKISNIIRDKNRNISIFFFYLLC